MSNIDKMNKIEEELRDLFGVKTTQEALDRMKLVLPLSERINEVAPLAMKELKHEM